MLKKLAVATAIGLFASFNTNAAAVDLSGWTAEGGSSSWNVQSGNDTVFQTVNGDPTVFFDSTATSTQGTALSGKIKVTSAGDWDDDFIGFALGYNSGEINSNSTDFMLVDWKQRDQNFGGTTGLAGISISHVTDASNHWNDFWSHDGGVNEIQRGTNLGSTGWADDTEYLFNIVFQSNLIEVTVDGLLELSITAADAGLSSFGDGSFAFYNMSQSHVLYSSIEETNCTNTPNAPQCQTGSVPEPTTLALMGLGLAGFASRKRKLSA